MRIATIEVNNESRVVIVDEAGEHTGRSGIMPGSRATCST